MKSIEQMGYSFTDYQIIMIFRRFDKDCDGTISKRDFYSEFEAIELVD
jgi:Ca2+-binding EF-hand superfamily protein